MSPADTSAIRETKAVRLRSLQLAMDDGNDLALSHGRGERHHHHGRQPIHSATVASEGRFDFWIDDLGFLDDGTADTIELVRAAAFAVSPVDIEPLFSGFG